MGITSSQLAAVPSVIAALAFTVVAVALVSDTGFGDASSLRRTGIALTTLAAAWFSVAGFSPRLARFNNVALVNVLLTLLGAELLLRFMVDRLPVSVVQMLPAATRSPMLRDRGLFTVDALQGSGQLFSWRPGLVIAGQKWVTIDRNGYRNASVPTATDVVLLGDSVTLAQFVRQDMASLLQQRGIPTLNLGFSAYGPNQERDAYRKYVIEPQIAHRLVVVNFCGCNDVENAQVYREVAARGGTWTDYLASEGTAFPFAFTPPWTVSILFNMPSALKRAWQYRQTHPPLALTLRRGTVHVTGWLPRRPLGDADWEPALAAVADIATLARSAGARLIIAYYPDSAALYLDGLARYPVLHHAAARDWSDATTRLRRLADDVGARFLDYTPDLQRAIGDRAVVTTEGDYHPNQEGVQIMVEALLPLVGDPASR
jgi:hypothetical protein